MDNDKQTVQEKTNTALMNHDEFDAFVKSKVISFLQTYNLSKILVDVGNGYKGIVKINKNGEIEAQVTIKEIM